MSEKRRDAGVVIELMLDRLGKLLPAEFFAQVGSAAERTAPVEASHFFSAFGFRLRFVLDSSSAQRLLKVMLEKKKSGVLDGMRAGFIKAFAPPLLDSEMTEHMARIAKRARVDAEHATKIYHAELRPLIEFTKVSDCHVNRASESIADQEDVDFLALYFDLAASALITEDHGFAAAAGVRVMQIKDVGNLHLVVRKQAVAVIVSASAAAVGVAVVVGIAKVITAIANFVRRYPGGSLIVGGAIAVLVVSQPKLRGQILAHLKNAKIVAPELWNNLEPWILGLVDVVVRRIETVRSELDRLDLGEAQA